MFDHLRNAETEVDQALAVLDPDVLEAKSAGEVMETFARIERKAAAGKALAARRLADSGAWRSDGSRSAAHWVAKRTGTTVGNAVGVIETAKKMQELPSIDKAVRAGLLSERQASAVVSAAAVSPTAQVELVDLAQREGIKTLQERCRAIEAAASEDHEARYDAIHKKRYVRHWTDHEGAFRLDARMTPDAGVKVLAALEPFKLAAYRKARKEGRREPFDAYGADGLVEMAKAAGSGGEGSRPPVAVNIRVDLASLARGHTEEGEICEIPGIGPIPVWVARSEYGEAFIKSILMNGTDIVKVAHKGRRPTAKQKTAIDERGVRCSVQGCDELALLEYDHITGYAKTKQTTVYDTEPKCGRHHFLKTYRGFLDVGGPGARRLVPPDRPKPRGRRLEPRAWRNPSAGGTGPSP